MTGKSDAIGKHRAEPDVDAPLTDKEFERGRTAMLARRARAATGLSQEAFAKHYAIPVTALREWEQGRRVPDVAAQSYLRVIAQIPDAVARVLHAAA
jgi:putative transcriptional regulator